jgi:hypothetical protein
MNLTIKTQYLYFGLRWCLLVMPITLLITGCVTPVKMQPVEPQSLSSMSAYANKGMEKEEAALIVSRNYRRFMINTLCPFLEQNDYTLEVSSQAFKFKVYYVWSYWSNISRQKEVISQRHHLEFNWRTIKNVSVKFMPPYNTFWHAGPAGGQGYHFYLTHQNGENTHFNVITDQREAADFLYAINVLLSGF